MLVRIIFFINNVYIWIEKGLLCYIAEVIFKARRGLQKLAKVEECEVFFKNGEIW